MKWSDAAQVQGCGCPYFIQICQIRQNADTEAIVTVLPQNSIFDGQ